MTATPLNVAIAAAVGRRFLAEADALDVRTADVLDVLESFGTLRQSLRALLEALDAESAGKDIPAGDESTQPADAARCPAAHPDDASPCEGDQDAVTVVDREGAEALGCVHHAARLYASLDRPRVYPSEGHLGAAVEVYRRAQRIAPSVWPEVGGR